VYTDVGFVHSAHTVKCIVICFVLCRMQATPAAVIEMTAIDEPAVVQRPTEPIVQQAETEIVDETKYVYRSFDYAQIPHFWYLLF